MTWSITESALEAPLDGAGRGQVSFVVQNVGAAQDRAMLVIDPLDGAAAGWFTVANPQQVVKPSESVTYLCQVAVPAGTPPATYAFQARAYSADGDSSETAVTSRRVTCTVAAAPVQPKRRPWWPYALAAAVLIIVIGAVVALTTRNGGATAADTTVAAPSTTPAPTTATTVGLAATTPPAVTVAGGGPARVSGALQATAGQWSLPADQLTLTYQWLRCDGTGNQCTAIPGATGAPYTPALADAGQTLRVEVKATETAAAGQRSATARSAPTDPVLIPVPDVFGRSLSDATALLTASGFNPQVGPYQFPPQCRLTVLNQAPVPGLFQPKGTVVTITVNQPFSLPGCDRP